MTIEKHSLGFDSDELFSKRKLQTINRWYKKRNIPIRFLIKGNVAYQQTCEYPPLIFAAHSNS